MALTVKFLTHLFRQFSATPCMLCGARALRRSAPAAESQTDTDQSNAELVDAENSLSSLFCNACEHSLPFLSANGCPQCAIEDTGGHLCGVCLAYPPKFDATVAAFRYQFPLNRLVQDFKFNANFALLALFANALADRILSSLDMPDVIIPVPLSHQRTASRGFNQSALLAQTVAKKLNTKLSETSHPQKPIRVETQWLERLRDTPAQAGLAPDARRRNIRGAFALSKAGAAAIEAQPNLKIALLDDVITTGATLSEAANVLKGAGVAYVTALVVARVPPPRAKTQMQKHGNLIG